MLRFVAIIFAILFACISVEQAAASKRVALVIGNSSYEHSPKLKNPGNDAAAISKMLQHLGFEVLTGIDLKHLDFAQIVSAFSKKLKGADVGLFFYAGHGLQVNSQNYLAPVDATLETETSLAFEAVPLHLILKLMERSTKTNLVFLDACRDNPLARNLARSMGTRSTSIGRGLAREETGLGTLISFATQPGNVALDGEGLNSPFTRSLLRHIETPDLDVALVLRRVREDVIKSTSGSQVPWTNSSLTGSFIFSLDSGQTQNAPTANREQKPSTHPTSFSGKQPAWAAYEETKEVGSCGAFSMFEKAYPDTFHAGLSREWRRKNCKLEEKLANIQSNDTTTDTARTDIPDNPRELALALQKELNRVGCDAGRPDGDWGPRSRGALSQFNTHTKLALPIDIPSSHALEAVNGKKERVCPEPAKRQVVKKPTQSAKKPVASKKPRGPASRPCYQFASDLKPGDVEGECYYDPSRF